VLTPVLSTRSGQEQRSPRSIAVTPDGKTVYAVSLTAGVVNPISTATNTAGRPIRVGKQPQAIAITPDGKTAYVSTYRSGTVIPISTATNTAGRPIRVGKGSYTLGITP
jgi:YVTN family beta-propeller protein